MYGSRVFLGALGTSSANSGGYVIHCLSIAYPNSDSPPHRDPGSAAGRWKLYSYCGGTRVFLGALDTARGLLPALGRAMRGATCCCWTGSSLRPACDVALSALSVCKRLRRI